MYEDTWYHIVPEFKPQDEGLAQKPVQQRRRKESLLKQPNVSTFSSMSCELGEETDEYVRRPTLLAQDRL